MSMIERVARALLVAKFGPDATILFERVPEGLPISVEAQAKFDERVEQARKEARAAIEAMRSTTNTMDIAGVKHLRGHSSDASGCFEAMILAALKGEAE